jgi:PAS domain S-box-containing protein
MRVRARLAWLVVAALLPVILLAAILLVRNVRQDRTAIENRARQQARTLLRASEHKLDTSLTTLRAMGASSLLDVPDLRAFHAFLGRAQREAHPEWTAAGLLDPSGRVLLSTLAPFGTTLPSYADNAAVREALFRRQSVVSDLATGRLSRRPGVGLLVPITRDGETRYLLAAALPAEAVASFVDTSTLPPTWSVRVLDRRQVAIAHVPFSAEAVGHVPNPGFLAQTRAAPEGLWRSVNPEGEPFYTAYTRSDRFGWTVGVVFPATEIERPARGLFWTLGTGGLALLLLGLGVAYFVSRSITRPIASVVEAADAIGRRETPKARPSGVTEVDDVGRALTDAAAEREQSEAALRASEARLRTTLMSIGDGVIAADTAGRVTFMNPVAEQMTGWSTAEAIGQPIESVFVVIDERTRLPVRNPVIRAISEGAMVGFPDDTLLIHRSGREIAIEDSGAPIQTPDGDIAGAVLVFRDDSLKRAATAQFRIIADSAPVFIWMAGPDQRRTFFNKPWLELTGRSMEQELGTGWTEGLHPDDVKPYLDAQRAAFEAQKPFSLEYRVRRQDGEYRWLLDHGVPRLEPDGTFSGYLASSVDITERRQAEESRRYLAAVVEGSDDAIVTKTLKGVITSWNPGAVRMFGYTPDEAIGQSIMLIIPPERAAEEQEVLARLLRGEGLDHFETVRIHKNGTRLDISLTVSPIHGPDGRLIGASKVARDISAAKRIERESAEVLAREQAARSEAEAANQAKDDFLATLSHELRTPLSGILGWAQVVRTRDDPATLAQALDGIERNAQSQLRLIEDLLDLSRIVAGKVRLESRPVDLRSVILAAADTIRPAAEAKEIRLALNLEAGVSIVLGDADRLQQIFWNLLSNAVKFTPREGLVTVELERRDSRAHVRISDSGQGISPEHLPFIFERFRQADSSTRRAHGGLGLGLSIVRSLAELQGGVVTAASAGEGRGATFAVSLPLVLIPAGDSPGTTPTPRRPYEGPRCDGIRVLVVDDEPDARRVLTAFLEDCGASVVAAGTAGEALGLLDRQLMDVVVSDLAMPEEDGLALARRIRARETGKQGHRVSLVALTAHAGPQVRIQALAAGFDAHVAKPIDAAELAAVVKQLTERSRGR